MLIFKISYGISAIGVSALERLMGTNYDLSGQSLSGYYYGTVDAWTTDSNGNFDKNRLTIDAKNVPVGALCRVITEKTGVAVVPNRDFTVNVLIFVQNVLLDELVPRYPARRSRRLSKN